MAKSWRPWVKAAGYLAATAGAASMAYQLYLWRDSSEFKSWVTNFINKNDRKVTELANTEIGPKLLIITTATTPVIILGMTSTIGNHIISKSKSLWNEFIKFHFW